MPIKIPLVQSKPPQIVVGRYTYGQPLFRIYTPQDRIEIGSFCSIAHETNFFGGGEHSTKQISMYPFNTIFGLTSEDEGTTKGKLTVGNDVWIGFGATLLSGVTVGSGAVIGARAVVTKNVEPYSIVAGNPARHLRFRFGPEERARLLKLAWWDWPIDRILANIPELYSTDIAAFLKKNEPA